MVLSFARTLLAPSACRFRAVPLLGRWLVMVVLAGLSLCAGPVTAQEQAKISPPEELSLETKDGVVLRCTYFPGTKGKESVPVVLLHPFKGNRHNFATLPTYLQEK